MSRKRPHVLLYSSPPATTPTDLLCEQSPTTPEQPPSSSSPPWKHRHQAIDLQQGRYRTSLDSSCSHSPPNSPPSTSCSHSVLPPSPASAPPLSTAGLRREPCGTTPTARICQHGSALTPGSTPKRSPSSRSRPVLFPPSPPATPPASTPSYQQVTRPNSSKSNDRRPSWVHVYIDYGSQTPSPSTTHERTRESPIHHSSSTSTTLPTSKSRIDDIWASDPKRLAQLRAQFRELKATIAQGPQPSSTAEKAVVDRGTDYVTNTQPSPLPLQRKYSSPGLHYPSPVVPDIPSVHHDWEVPAQRPSYQASTKSSAAKMSICHTTSPRGQSGPSPRAKIGSSTALSQNPPGVLPPRFPAPEVERNVFGKVLGHLTGLHDRDFYTTPASHVQIPDESYTDILDQALRLSQVTLEESAYVYMPEVHRKHWFESSSTVKLGTTELSKGPLGGGLPGMLSNAIDKEEAIFAIQDLNELRNARSHPGTRLFPDHMARIDALVARGHRVACALHNYRRAMQFHELRKRLQQIGKMCWNEIAHPSVAHTPETKWAPHHERLFEEVLKFPFRTPKEIVAAATIWNRGGHPLSAGYPTGRRIRDRDEYIRESGQDDSYFRRVNRLPFEAGTRDHQEIIRTLGAPKELAEMSLEEMTSTLTDMEDEKRKQDNDTAAVAQMEDWSWNGQKVNAEVQDAVDARLFSHH